MATISYRPGRKASIFFGAVAAIVVFFLAFQWNWLRHPVERYFISHSHREMRIGHLDIDWNHSLEPTIRVQDLYVENAPWADKRPLITAKEAAFTVSLKSLWHDKTVISKLVLVDAELDMERQADGLRNWRLKNPEYRGPGKVVLQSLEPHNTSIRFVRRDVGIDVTANATSSQARKGKTSDVEHPLRVQFKGEFSGAPFSGDVDAGPVLTFLDTGRAFALRGTAVAGKSRIEVDGTIADMFDPTDIDGDVHLAGHSLGDLHPLLRARLPASRAYDFTAHVRQTVQNTSFAKLHGKIGGSDLAGELVLIRGKDKPTLSATLRSKYTDLDDIGPLVGRPGRGNADHGRAKTSTAAAQADEKPAAQGQTAQKRIFSDHQFDGAPLQKIDAHLVFEAKRFRMATMPALQSLHVTADLAGGVLKLDPIDVGLADGHVAGHFSLDGNRKPMAARARVDFKDVRIEQLLASLSRKAKSAGPLQGRVNLKAEGNSLAAIAASATGPAEVDLTAGGISNLVDAGIGLNAGKAVRLLITGDRVIGVNNAKVAFDFEHGQGTSKAIVLDTDQTHTEGTGNIDLRNETFDVLLTPHPKKAGLLRLHSSIRLHGPLREPKVTLAKNP